jgi:dTDP-4-dehydrorhamnose 3,5-epimerase
VKFSETPLLGAYCIDLDRHEDERGFFARTYCQEEFAAHGLSPHIAQCNLSVNREKGTLRGLHYQAAPNQEAKLVTCIRGEVYDVVVDIRPSSPTFLRWHAVVLSRSRRNALFIPEDFAHGFLTLTADTEVFYQMSAPYSPESARGLRWDDPVLAISWPDRPRVISDRDRNHPLLQAPS